MSSKMKTNWINVRSSSYVEIDTNTKKNKPFRIKRRVNNSN